MKAFLWVLGSILILDVLLVAIFAACAAVVRRRTPRPVLSGAVEWPLEAGTERPQLLAAVPAAAAEDDEPVPPRRARVRLVRDTGPPAAPPPARTGRHRVAGVALAAALAVASTAVASPEVRRFMATAIDVVSGGLGSSSVDASGQTAGIGGDDTATGGDASQTPDAAAESSTTAGRPGVGSTPGPAVDPRPTGVPHQGVAVPAAPTTVTAMPAGSGEIDVAWADVADETAYQVERAPDITGPWVTAAAPGRDVTTVRDAGLSAGTTYFYRVVAINGDVESIPSDVASATTGVDVPASPTMRITVAGTDRIDLAWDDVAGETGYRIERSTDGGSGWTTIGTTGRDVTTATDASLEAGATYWYRVFASNPAGESPPSETAQGTTDQPPSGDPGDGVEAGSAGREAGDAFADTDVGSTEIRTRRGAR